MAGRGCRPGRQDIDLADADADSRVRPQLASEETHFLPIFPAACSPGGLREVLADARLLEMIASNLISNAIRYTPAGGSVQVELRRRGEKLVLGVRDTGVGIAPEHHKRIFERLYRIDGTRDGACQPTPRVYMLPPT